MNATWGQLPAAVRLDIESGEREQTPWSTKFRCGCIHGHPLMGDVADLCVFHRGMTLGFVLADTPRKDTP